MCVFRSKFRRHKSDQVHICIGQFLYTLIVVYVRHCKNMSDDAKEKFETRLKHLFFALLFGVY